MELVEVDVTGGLAVEEGDGLEGDEEEIGRVGAGVGPGILGPLAEVVDVGAVEEELASLDGVGWELAGADVVGAVEEVEIAPAHVEAVVALGSVDEEGHGRQVDPEESAGELEGDGYYMGVPGDGVGAGGEAETDVEGGRGGDVLEAGRSPAEDGCSEGAVADGGTGLEAELGGGPRGSVDDGGDAPAGDVMLLEKVMDEDVQEGVAV